MILAASIVGSGELIATTTLGAQVGYTALWIIVLSCAIKPVVQAELGRYAIASGETGLEALDHLPGPRLGVGWLPVALYWLLASPVKMVVAGGIAQAVMLPLVGAGAVWLRHRRLPPELAPSAAVTVGLWAAALFMAAMMAYYAWLIAASA